MTGDNHYNLVNEEKICPECGLHAPKRQVENLGKCERCSMESGEVELNGEKLNPETNVIDKWKLATPNAQNNTPVI